MNRRRFAVVVLASLFAVLAAFLTSNVGFPLPEVLGDSHARSANAPGGPSTQQPPPGPPPGAPPSPPPSETPPVDPGDEMACNVTDTHVAYTAVFGEFESEPGYVVDKVTITITGSQCVGASLEVILTNDADNAIGTGSAEIGGATVEIVIDDPKPLARDVTGVHVAVKPPRGRGGQP